jgi:putative ABC transport system permease protein
VHRLLASLRSFWNGLRRPSQLDADMNDEMRFHIDMEARRLMEQHGLDISEAQRRAAIAFGGVEKYRGAGRDALGLTWLRGLSTDFKLGARMLRKYPGLTAVALFALSLAIGAGSAYLEFINDLMHGKLPFPEADRIVGIQLWDQESGSPEHRQTAEFAEWRGTLHSFEDLAAYRTLESNLITNDGRVEPVRGVEISASAFQIARVPPILGRPLLPEDERGGATPVVVIGYDLWTTRFGSDSGVIGQTVRLGKTPYTVVGVMPDGFGLPISHSLWVPLQLNDAAYPRHQGPRTNVMGKLAAGMTVSGAQAELDARQRRAAADYPATDRHIQPVVKSYVESIWSATDDSRVQSIAMYAANLLFIGLLSLCGANVATLVFARTATREAEISVRSALGASRARIAGQLFAEALVLSSLAALIGLAIASYGLLWVKNVVAGGQGRPLMFWWNDQLRPATLAYAAALAILSALIVGVIPALKATSVQLQDRLKHSSGGSSSGLKFGGVWTAVIMAQVAVTVIFLSMVGLLGWSAYVSNGGERQRNFPANEYVAVRLTLDRPPTDTTAEAEAVATESRRQFRATYAELARRLAAEPVVASTTYGMQLPGMNLQDFRIEVDGETNTNDAAPFIRTTNVGVNYFDAFGAPIIAGRGFSEADLEPGRNVAIVDSTFVRKVFNGQDAIGRHVRDLGVGDDEPGPWLEIVGVIPDLTDDTNKRAGDAMLFQPAAAESLSTIYLAVHARSNPTALMSRIRLIASEVDPGLRLLGLTTLDKLGEADKIALDFFARLLAGISLVAIILATAGVYALMSFTVSRRTSEIGIRLALGANPRRIVMTTFARALAQVGGGLLIGAIPATVVVTGLGPEVAPNAGTQVAIGTIMLALLAVGGISAIACVAPARRALRIQPTDALKST